MLAADALGNFTPLGLLASEPTKIILTRSRIFTVRETAAWALFARPHPTAIGKSPRPFPTPFGSCAASTRPQCGARPTGCSEAPNTSA